MHNRGPRSPHDAARPVRSLAVPGLCTGVGGMGYAQAARQMRAAYESVARDGWRRVAHSAMAPLG